MADVIKVVQTGLGIITNRLKNGSTGTTEPNFISWGTGTTAPVSANTALETPRAEARVSGTSSQQTTTLTNDTYRVVGSLTCASTSAAITEMGLFDASTSGNMFMRATFSPINVNVGDSIQFTVNTQFIPS